MTSIPGIRSRVRVVVLQATGRVRQLAARVRPLVPRLTGDEYARALLLAAARGWLTDTTPTTAADRDADVLAEVERRYPGGVRQLALDTFTDAMTSTPLPRLVATAATPIRAPRVEGA